MPRPLSCEARQNIYKLFQLKYQTHISIKTQNLIIFIRAHGAPSLIARILYEKCSFSLDSRRCHLALIQENLVRNWIIMWEFRADGERESCCPKCPISSGCESWWWWRSNVSRASQSATSPFKATTKKSLSFRSFSTGTFIIFVICPFLIFSHKLSDSTSEKNDDDDDGGNKIVKRHVKCQTQSSLHDT